MTQKEEFKKEQYIWAEAIGNYQNNHYGFAIELFSKLIENADSKFYYDAIYMRGCSFLKLDNKKKAIRDFDFFISFDLNETGNKLNFDGIAMSKASAYYYRAYSKWEDGYYYGEVKKDLEKAIILEKEPHSKCLYLAKLCSINVGTGFEEEFNKYLKKIKTSCKQHDISFIEFEYLDKISKNFKDYFAEANIYLNPDGSSNTGAYDKDGNPFSRDTEKQVYVKYKY